MHRLLAALILAPAAAAGAPVILDFEDGEAVFGPPSGYGNDTSSYWAEEGFEIRASGQWAEDEEDADLLSIVDGPYELSYALTNFQNKYATGLEAQVTSYSITRGDGGAFDFVSLLADAYHAQTIVYEYTFEDGSQETEYVRNKVGFVRITGQKADGSASSERVDVEYATDLGLDDVVEVDIAWTNPPED